MRVMRRTGLVAFVTALVVLIGAAPSHAVDVVNPVDPIPGLPSTAQKAWHTSAGGIGNDMMKLTQWWVSQIQAGKAGGAVSTGLQALPKAVPITAPAAVPKLSPVAAGGPAGLALSGWFVIGGAGAAVSFVGSAVGADLDGAMCGADQWLQTGYGILTMGMGPSCVSVVADPNADASGGLVLSYGGMTGKYYGRGNLSNGHNAFLYTGLKDLPSNLRYGSLKTDGTVNGSWGWTVSTQACYQGGTRVTGVNCFNIGTTAFSALREGVVILDASTNAVVATTKEVTGDPMRDSVCTLTWKDGTTTTGHVGQYRESEGFPIGAVDAACTSALVSKPGGGPGLLPSEIKIGSTNTETGAQTEIAKQAVPDFNESEKVGLTPGDNTGLRLLKVVDGVTQSCMTWEAACASWWPQTSQGTQPTVDTGTYRCEYGGRQVSLTECGPYRETFDTKTNTPTITDPVTGDKADWSSTPDPANSPGTGGQAGQSPTQCVTSFTLNPVDWVMRPLRCLFEPRQSVVTAAQNGVTTAWTNSAVGAWSTALAGWSFQAPPSGCSGIVIPLDVWFGHDVDPVTILNACPGTPLAPWAATSSVVITILSGIGLIRSATRSLGGMVGTRGLSD